jgi:hypothetical protein
MPACLERAAGKFSSVTGSISNEWTCNAGTTGPNGVETCTSCEFGKYKSVAGSTECTGCAAGKFYLANSDTAPLETVALYMAIWKEIRAKCVEDDNQAAQKALSHSTSFSCPLNTFIKHLGKTDATVAMDLQRCVVCKNSQFWQQKSVSIMRKNANACENYASHM